MNKIDVNEHVSLNKIKIYMNISQFNRGKVIDEMTTVKILYLTSIFQKETFL